MKKLVLILSAVILFSACAVSRTDFRTLEERVSVAEEKIVILEEQARTGGSYEQMMALNNRINSLESRLAAQNEPVFTPPPVERNVFVANIDMLYEQGRNQYEARDFAGAITTFQQVLEQSPDHDLAANSIYWIGESYYAMADFTAARQAFQRVQDNYPNSNKFIDAQVKIAMTWIRHGNNNQARTILQAIKRDFPNYERMHVVDQNLRLVR